MTHFFGKTVQVASATLSLFFLMDAGWSQSALSEAGVGDDGQFLVELDAYVKYGGNIDVIDGFTGKNYHSDNAVVKAIHTSFPKIMGGLHNRLLELEAKHMAFQMTQGITHGRKLTVLADAFGIKGFELDDESWLRKERTILARLRAKPFFQIKEIIVWEKEGLSERALRGNRLAQNLRFNPDSLTWERRVLTEWEVAIRNKRKLKIVNKLQGLNLDTNKGFHISETLPNSVYVNAFREVKVSYPIIVSRTEDSEEQITRIQRQIVRNLSYLYDPFSWAARRNTRFRTKFSSSLVNHMKNRSYRVNDREWFDAAICNFLNDMVTVEMYGLKEVYSLYTTRRFANDRYLLGLAMDPLNWLEGEDRSQSSRKGPVRVRFSFNNSEGARFAMLDMYLRYGYAFGENLRSKLVALKKKESGRALVEQAIEEVSGVPAETYIKAALKAQAEGVLQYWEKLNNHP